jgi:hypothetical protein
MGLPASEQRVLDTIENDLRITDQQLAAAFAAFTRFASGTRMPRPERLTAWHLCVPITSATWADAARLAVSSVPCLVPGSPVPTWPGVR